MKLILAISLLTVSVLFDADFLAGIFFMMTIREIGILFDKFAQ